MLSKIGTIREFKTDNFHVIVDAVEEYDLDLSWDETGETARGLDNGNLIAFCARAGVSYKSARHCQRALRWIRWPCRPHTGCWQSGIWVRR